MHGALSLAHGVALTWSCELVSWLAGARMPGLERACAALCPLILVQCAAAWSCLHTHMTNYWCCYVLQDLVMCGVPHVLAVRQRRGVLHMAARTWGLLLVAVCQPFSSAWPMLVGIAALSHASCDASEWMVPARCVARQRSARVCTLLIDVA